MKKLISSSLLSLALLSNLSANEIKQDKVPKKKKAQTNLALYVKAKDAMDYLNKNKDAILIDVRTPSEIMFIGASKRTDFYIPLFTIDNSKYWDKKQTYALKKNKYVVEEIVYELKKKNAKKDSAIFITCRSGSSRSAPVVNMLEKKGYTNVWTITDGFQGSKEKSGDLKGHRVKNGLQHVANWSYKVPKDKLWFECKYKDLFNKEDRKNCK